jgi:A/G-specific adenine glycosylase
VNEFTAAVLAWGEPRLRELPWRATRDPWAILVSEMMLQQTQVARVIPKYLAFIDQFPSPDQCAAAPLGDVLRMWHGLGYPRRARNLHAAASHVSELGGFPTSLEELMQLPGVGPYSARAVMAFAFELDVAVVDTNIARVLARFSGRRLAARDAQRLADDALASGRSWAWNQSIMDLGATVCRPAKPTCDQCPAAKMCAWRGSGPDPAVGSAGVSSLQSRFDGSDRQARGNLMRALVQAPVSVADAALVMGRDQRVAARLVEGLIGDGLCVVDDFLIRLP